MGPGPWSPTDSKPLPPPMDDEYTSNPQRPYGILDAPGSPATSFGGSFANYPHHQNYSSGSGYDFRSMPLSSQGPPVLDPIDRQSSVDDFGMSTRSGLIDNSNTAGGRFATFPVKTRPAGITGGYTLHDSPSISPRHDQEQSLSASIAQALDTASQKTSRASEIEQPEMVSPGWGRVNENPPPPQVAAPSTKDLEDSPSQGWSGPTTLAPAAHEITTQQPPALAGSPTATSPLPPPPGAAAPDLSDPWANAPRDGSLQAPSHTRSISQISHNDDALLAYMTAPHEESNTTDEEADISKSGVDSAAGALKPGRPTSYEEQQRISRHVRFGEGEGLGGALKENRRSLEKERQLQERADVERVSPIETIRNSNERERGMD